MDYEHGTMGTVGWNNQRLTIDRWRLDHETRTANVYCDERRFAEQFGISVKDFSDIIGSGFLVRMDHDNGIYYASAICTGVAKPNLPQPTPHLEYFPNSLALYLTFHHPFGNIPVCSAIAMARNGNNMFYDLLCLTEISTLSSRNDIRFMSLSGDKAAS